MCIGLMSLMESAMPQMISRSFFVWACLELVISRLTFNHSSHWRPSPTSIHLDACFLARHSCGTLGSYTTRKILAR